MKKCQAFKILSKYGSPRDANVILRGIGERISSFWIWRAAYQLRRGTPVAKIIHKKWFYGLEFYTNKYTLDPRPDSETLVEAVLADSKQKINILDLGTGTGCLICAIAKNLPDATGIGIDKSTRAIRVAKKNVKDLGLDNKIKISKGNFYLRSSLFALRYFDVIISNPPYIAKGDSRVDSGAMHDPKMALYAGSDGLTAYRAIAKSAGKHLKTGGKIYLEIGAGQGAAVRDIFESAGWIFAAAHNDLSGTQRVMVFSN
ncbi:MAG: peptide chain release factor N(5)-glutamine methyltransferase [Rickettsiales bacterium]|jgi:release factor glutamine methyltransferase|nr:peptide chain release factor N(5)-glutamine methyltransferase [Rickettsiales bacterium]